MSEEGDFLRAAERALYLEGYYLDLQRWDDWLNLFTLDLVYWVPAWKSDHELTNSPKTEMSFIYYTNRNGLEDRIVRATSGLSPASVPLARTTHSVSNILITDADRNHLHVSSTWINHIYQPKDRRMDLLFGRSEHVLQSVEGSWRIARKKTVIVNEVLPSIIDFYHL